MAKRTKKLKPHRHTSLGIGISVIIALFTIAGLIIVSQSSPLFAKNTLAARTPRPTNTPRPTRPPRYSPTPTPTTKPLPTLTSIPTTPTPTPNTVCPGSTGYVRVTSPNGGNTFNVGDTVTINWCISDISKYTPTGNALYLSSRATQTNGTHIYQGQFKIIENIPMTLGQNSFTWTIPAARYVTDSVTGEVVEYKVGGGSFVFMATIASYGVGTYDYSDQTFTILNSTLSAPISPPTSGICAGSTGTVQVLAPNGGETYSQGSVLPIRWCLNTWTEYNQAYARLYLHTRDTQGVLRLQQKITTNVPMQVGENLFNWTIPTTVPIGSQYVILSEINTSVSNLDQSNLTFSITQ